ncbi:hypothetical protein [Paenibacillus daejeonensis]|uniref:hypothetical protein n=1 Tax=Paenibacillus daejeonensis TaxID=135193 RepID=UPI0012F7752E|nr:hypothetical protein [Paenibacillus daejeonensis]
MFLYLLGNLLICCCNAPLFLYLPGNPLIGCCNAPLFLYSSVNPLPIRSNAFFECYYYLFDWLANVT